MNDFYVYILRCNDNTYYVGHTDDLEKRVIAHNEGRASTYTAGKLPVTLMWFESFQTRSEAFEAERKLKNWNRQKKQIVMKYGWKSLKGWKRNGASTHTSTRKTRSIFAQHDRREVDFR